MKLGVRTGEGLISALTPGRLVSHDDSPRLGHQTNEILFGACEREAGKGSCSD